MQNQKSNVPKIERKDSEDDHLKNHSHFIPSLRHLYGTYHTPSTVLNSGETAVNKTDRVPDLKEIREQQGATYLQDESNS